MHLIANLLIGALCGWLASKLMKSKSGLLFYIIAGIIGGGLGGLVFKIIGFSATNLLGSIISGVVGTCLLIWLCRLIFKK